MYAVAAHLLLKIGVCRGRITSKGGDFVDTLTFLLVLIPNVLSSGIAIFYAYLAYKKSKEPPKDEVWETATKILCSRGGTVYSDDFVELYSELKFFKEHPELDYSSGNIESTMRKVNGREANRTESLSAPTK